LLLGALGTILFFFRNSEFGKFASQGPAASDVIHTVLVNNHGTFSYITQAQNLRLRWLEIVATGLLVLMVVVHLLQKRVFR
jgi:hypothetical protein